MKPILLYTLLGLFMFQANAQFSEANIIDDAPDTEGIRHMVAADFNNNGFNDIVVVQAASNDRVVIYWNSGNANFTKEIIDHPIDDPVSINYGDFNSNGFKDLLIVTESNSEIFFTKTFKEFFKTGYN